MVERNTRIRASQIRSILPDDLEVTNALVDNYVPSYDDTTGKFTWVAMAGGLANVIEDITPQLGGNLDLNGFNIDFPSVANISDVKDEDDMFSDSATMLATQRSIKKYVDNSTQTLFEIDINGDLQPVTITQVDANFELDGSDDIQPQSV